MDRSQRSDRRCHRLARGRWPRQNARHRAALLLGPLLFAASLTAVQAAPPEFSVLALEITPADQRDFCAALPGVNDPLDLRNLALEEDHVLRLVLLASDADGDPLNILPPQLSATVDRFQHTIEGDTLEVTIDLGSGWVRREMCERLGDLVVTVREEIPAGETVSETFGFYGMWAGADLAAQLEDVEPSYPLGAVAAIWGRIRAVSGAENLSVADTFDVHIVITSPTGLPIGRSARITGNFIPYRIEAPRFTFTVPGQYEARLYFEGRDLNPDNNDQRIPFTVGSGPLQVYPNAITPNGDGANDAVVFRFENQAVVYPFVRIFTVDGRKIFESDRMEGSRILWDGRDDQGRLVEPGSYLYVVYDGLRTLSRGVCAVVR